MVVTIVSAGQSANVAGTSRSTGDLEKQLNMASCDPRALRDSRSIQYQRSSTGLGNANVIPASCNDVLTLTTEERKAGQAAYRTLPIFSGVMIPFSIMLSIPSLTGHWYVRTGEGHKLIEVRSNPVLLDTAMAFSMACGALANICLVIRFSERRIKLMTIMCIIFLSLHDIINIPAVTIFGVVHRFDDGFTYGQSFWLTVCSTIFSSATNITLIYDYTRTEDFEHSGSGLTSKQRALVVIIIVLLCYVSLGSFLMAITLNITFLDALYLTVVSIETIGFGDLHPTSTGTRVLACVYISGGILNLALLVALAREALLEAAAESVQRRLEAAHAHARERNIRARWRAAVHWRLRAKGLPMWIDDREEERQQRVAQGKRRHWYSWLRYMWRRLMDEVWREWEDPAWKYVYGPSHKRLNLEALSEAQLETAALEAGLSLAELVPKGLKLQREEEDDNEDGPSIFRTWQNPTVGATGEAGHPPSLTHVRMGGMVSLLSHFALAVTHGSTGDVRDLLAPSESEEITAVEENFRPHGVPFTHTLTTATWQLADDEKEGIYRPESLETVERNAFYARLSLALTLFFMFWIVGSAIFMKTENWSFGSSLYFCFVSFSTVGYGDLSPQTPAGRSIFIVWALLGVGTMTILISILAEAYSSSYKNLIKTVDIKVVKEIYFEDGGNPLKIPEAAQEENGESLAPSSLTLASAGDTWTPIPAISTDSSPSLITQSTLRRRRSSRGTLMVAIPEDPPYDADLVDSVGKPALSILVLQHVEQLRSLLDTRSHTLSDGSSPETQLVPEVSFDSQNLSVDIRIKIEERLTQLATIAKDAIRD